MSSRTSRTPYADPKALRSLMPSAYSGHLLPGGEAEAAALLDEYHARCRQEADHRHQRCEPAMV
ncbi:MAG: hypothetical protein ACM3VU_00335 [Arthrospira platensis]